MAHSDRTLMGPVPRTGVGLSQCQSIGTGTGTVQVVV